MFFSISYSTTIIAVGDLAPGVIGTPMKLDKIFEPVKPYLKGDIVFGNLEGVFLNKNITSTKHKKTNSFSFRLREINALLLKDAGFTILNFNNNHSNDYGTIGRNNTKKVLKSLNIHCLTDSLTVDSIAYLSFYLHSTDSCIVWNDSFQQLTQKLSENSKILITSIHGGQEGSDLVRDDCEKYLNEYRGNLYEFSKNCIDAGADIVLCHGPHVIRKTEIYKNKVIAYSLGNFCTPFGFNLKDKFGEVLILKIVLNEKNELEKIEETKFRQIRNQGFIKQ
jgi:hypothetical protein